MQTTVSSRVEGNALKVLIKAVNKGDEPAYNVQAEVRAGERKVLTEKVQELGVNMVYRVQGSFPLDYKKAGEYPLTVTMHYADGNMYPFSALTCQTFPYRSKALPAEVFGSIKCSAFWKKGKARLVLKNMGDSAVSAVTRLAAPRELTVAEESIELEIPPKSSASADFEIENFSALGGSTYQVFAISEYEKGGLHHTSISPGLIRIEETREIFGVSYVVLFAGLALLVLVLIAAQFWRKKKVGT